MAGRQPSYESIEAAIFFGSVARELERYQDLVEAMKSAALLMNGKELPKAAMWMLDIGYKREMLAKRKDRDALVKAHRKRTAGGIMTFDLQHLTWLCHYVSKVDAEMDKICSDAKPFIDAHVLPFATSSEDKLFYHKLLADLYMCRSASKTGDGWKEAASASLYEYERAEVFAGKVPGNSPLRLSLAVNFSNFCSVVLNKPERARDIINTAVGAALSGPEELDKTCKELVEMLKTILRFEDPAA